MAWQARQQTSKDKGWVIQVTYIFGRSCMEASARQIASLSSASNRRISAWGFIIKSPGGPARYYRELTLIVSSIFISDRSDPFRCQ
jgi:hypothetical protein